MSQQAQPFPHFYVLRPDRQFVPLIPLDELPEWLQFGGLDWHRDLSLFHSMTPATPTPIPRAGEYDVFCLHCTETLENINTFQKAQIDQLNTSLSPSSTGSSGNQSRRVNDLRSFVSYPGVFVSPPKHVIQPSPIYSAPPYLPVYRQHLNKRLSNSQLNHWLTEADRTSGIMSPVSLSPNPLIPIPVPPSNLSCVASSLNPGAQDFKPSLDMPYKSEDSNESTPGEESKEPIYNPSLGWSSVKEPVTQLTTHEHTPTSRESKLHRADGEKVSKDISHQRPIEESRGRSKQRPRIRLNTSICSEEVCLPRGKKPKASLVRERKCKKLNGERRNGHETVPKRKYRPKRIRLGYHVRKRRIFGNKNWCSQTLPVGSHESSSMSRDGL